MNPTPTMNTICRRSIFVNHENDPLTRSQMTTRGHYHPQLPPEFLLLPFGNSSLFDITQPRTPQERRDSIFAILDQALAIIDSGPLAPQSSSELKMKKKKSSSPKRKE